MTEFDIIKHLSASIDHRKFPFQVPTSFIYGWECDFWCMTAGGETREFEIKISRADYFVDAKKEKHKECNGANYFYYVCPTGIIKKEDVDKKYGLVYVNEFGRVEIVKKPRKLNNNEFDRWKMLAEKFYYKYKTLWREKYIDEKITRDEYYDGLNIELTETESIENNSNQ